MTDRLTPAMLRDLANVVEHFRDSDGNPDRFPRFLEREAARREAEGADPMPGVLEVMRRGIAEMPDAPPPPAPMRDECDCQEPLIRCDTFGMRCEICGKPERLNTDAPPPNAPDLVAALERQSEALGKCWTAQREANCNDARKALLDAIEALRAERDALHEANKFMGESAFNNRARAEAAEADAKRLRELASAMLAKTSVVLDRPKAVIGEPCVLVEYDAARALWDALAQGGGDG